MDCAQWIRHSRCRKCVKNERKDHKLFLDTATLTGIQSFDEIVEHAKAKKVKDLGGDDPPICAPPFPRSYPRMLLRFR